MVFFLQTHCMDTSRVFTARNECSSCQPTTTPTTHKHEQETQVRLILVPGRPQCPGVDSGYIDQSPGARLEQPLKLEEQYPRRISRQKHEPMYHFRYFKRNTFGKKKSRHLPRFCGTLAVHRRPTPPTSPPPSFLGGVAVSIFQWRPPASSILTVPPTGSAVLATQR